jgi:hypothetical protein
VDCTWLCLVQCGEWPCTHLLLVAFVHVGEAAWMVAHDSPLFLCSYLQQPPEQLLQRAAAKQREREKKLEETRSLREYNEVRECTFTPQLQPQRKSSCPEPQVPLLLLCVW